MSHQAALMSIRIHVMREVYIFKVKSSVLPNDRFYLLD